MLKEANGDVLLHEKNMYLLIHEIMHTLGISKNAYDSLLMKMVKPEKVTSKLSPLVVRVTPSSMSLLSLKDLEDIMVAPL
jgi:hypothetical protein